MRRVLPLIALLACGRRDEPEPLARAVTTASAAAIPSASTPSTASAIAQAPVAPATNAPAPSAPVSTSSVAARSSADAGAVAPPSAGDLARAKVAFASASTTLPAAAPHLGKLLGTWTFARFDLEDPATAAKWKAIPKADQDEILREAPKALLRFEEGRLITRLEGVPDRIATFTVAEATERTIVIAVSDEGRKEIAFDAAGTMRIRDLEGSAGFATFFARKSP
jgi:hypothetical protein